MTEPKKLTDAEIDAQLDELMQFVDDNPDLSEDDLLTKLEEKFPREVIDAFTASFTGITPG